MAEALSIYDFVACRVDFAKLNAPWLQSVFTGNSQQRRLPKARFAPYLCHAGGGTLGVKKWVHDSVQGFDESLWVQEDTDYCFRIQATGVALHWVSDAVLHIRCRQTLIGLCLQAVSWAEYSMLLYKRYRTPTQRNTWHSWKIYLAQCLDLLISAPQISRDKTAKARWFRQCGWQIGVLLGSIKHHVPPV